MNPSPFTDYANDGQRITAPGKYEGCPIFAPHFWNLGLEGFADSDNGTVYTFKIDKGDRAVIPTLDGWIGRKSTLYVRQNDQGFIHCWC